MIYPGSSNLVISQMRMKLMARILTDNGKCCLTVIGGHDTSTRRWLLSQEPSVAIINPSADSEIALGVLKMHFLGSHPQPCILICPKLIEITESLSLA
jgi:hypothetical protein